VSPNPPSVGSLLNTYCVLCHNPFTTLSTNFLVPKENKKEKQKRKIPPPHIESLNIEHTQRLTFNL
jgi:hypothetical protein